MPGRHSVPEAVKKARGARLRLLRERVWGTQEAAAEALGIPASQRNYFSRYESGQNGMSTSEAKRPFAKALGVGTDDIEIYLRSDITLDDLLKRRREPDGRRVVDFSDPEQWAAAVRGMGNQLALPDEDVEAFIHAETKKRVLTRADQIHLALASFIDTLHTEGSQPSSANPPFLKTKRKRA